jgi:hypothetical protein
MRFVLVANNPKADLSRIRPTDALVQFNGGNRLRSHKGPRVYVWRKNGDGSVSGWHGAEPATDYAGDLHVLLGHDIRIEYECERRGWPFRSITRQPPHYRRGIPTTGFWALYILHRMRLPVALVGFTFKNVWPGHDWDYEKQWTIERGIPRL